MSDRDSVETCMARAQDLIDQHRDLPVDEIERRWHSIVDKAPREDLSMEQTATLIAIQVIIKILRQGYTVDGECAECNSLVETEDECKSQE